MDDKLRQPYQGQLIKFTNVVKGWQSRWFILDPERGSLEYYLNQGDKYEKARGFIQLAGAVISPSDEDSLTFTVSPAVGESYKLRAQDTRDRQMWINRLRVIAEMHTRAIAHHHPPLAPREHRIRENIPLAGHWENPGFGMGLDVIDAFTQVAEILEESQRQHAALAQSIEELPSYGSGMRCIDPNVLLIKAISQATLLCLDECLTALRSRHSALHYSSSHSNSHTSHVVSTSHQSKSFSLSPLVSPLLGRSPRTRRRNTADLPGTPRRRSSPIPSVRPHSSSPLRSIPSIKSKTAPQSPAPFQVPSSPTPPVKVHQTSSSPMPDEQDISGSPANKASAVGFASSQGSLERGPKSSSVMTSEASDVSCSHSSTYKIASHGPSALSNSDLDDTSCECEDGSNPSDDGEDAPVEEGQRSVIMHIISQLRLGMDLTRVTLPTFILEKRSLLEMFADFLGHPDLFLRISTCTTPEDRILAVVKWYLTSIHVGRQGSRAKKPYNPIIGEIFHCNWKVPVSDVMESDGTCSKSSDTQFYTIKYSAEQVSHHPPVSAFYIECPEKEMCVNAHIWTKSKFMGMSVGVNLVGSISLFLGKVSETYHLGMPSAYARSVLMEPWVELGGRINIHCPQSGYSAPVVFHTKPFYGGKLHRATCEIKNGAGHLICRVQGEWDSYLEFSYEGGRIETIYVRDLRLTHRKRVRPVEKQAWNESRCQWLDVTRALSRGSLDTATNHKKALEDRQRADEQRRALTHTPFPTKLFAASSPHNATDPWVYKELPKYAKSLLQNASSSRGGVGTDNDGSYLPPLNNVVH